MTLPERLVEDELAALVAAVPVVLGLVVLGLVVLGLVAPLPSTPVLDPAVERGVDEPVEPGPEVLETGPDPPALAVRPRTPLALDEVVDVAPPRVDAADAPPLVEVAALDADDDVDPALMIATDPPPPPPLVTAVAPGVRVLAPLAGAT